MENEKQYIPLNGIPKHIHEAAQSLNHYFEKEGMRYWEFCSVADRRLVNKLERERDEAREAFKEMWRSGDAFLPHVDAETINRWRKAAGWEETK